VSRKPRPVPWPTDEEFLTVIAGTEKLADRFILNVLRLHDHDPGSPAGAYPGYARIAGFTRYAPSYVRKRLAAMVREGILHTEPMGRFTMYFIVPTRTVGGMPARTAAQFPVAPVSRDDPSPAYDVEGRPAPWLEAMAAETWGESKRGKR
jgi:hypothetical protein